MKLDTFQKTIIYGLVALMIILAIVFYPKPQPKAIVVERKSIIAKEYPEAIVTYYQPTNKQCGNSNNKCFDGSNGRIGICAVSQKILDYYCNISDTIEIKGSYAGRYRVTDKAKSKGLLIDIWKPVNYKGIKTYYKSKFKVL